MVKSKRIIGMLKKSMAMLLTASMVLSADIAVFADEAVDKAGSVIEVLDGEEESVDASEDLSEKEAVEGAEGLLDNGATDELAIETVSDNEADALAVSENDIETTELDGAVEVPGDDGIGLMAPTAVKATFDKKGRIVISWKKSKGAKGYYIYKMKADGTADMSAPIAETSKCKYVYEGYSTDETYAYKIMPHDVMGKKGYPEYVVCTPSIINVNRRDDSDDPSISPTTYRMNVGYTDIKGASGYEFQRTNYSKKDYITMSMETVPGTTKVLFNGKYIDQAKIIDGNSCIFNKTYYYKVCSKYLIAGRSTPIISAYSKAVSGKVLERAPKEGGIEELSGSRILISWEDMEKTGVLSEDDTYSIYASENGGEYKQLVKEVDFDHVEYVAIGAKPEEVSDNFKTYAFPTISYVLPRLKGKTNYTFKVVAIKNGKAGDKSNGENFNITTKVLAPKVTQKQSKQTIKFSWDKMKKAVKYDVTYEVGEKGKDGWQGHSLSVDPDKASFTIKDLMVAVPVRATITVRYEDGSENSTVVNTSLKPENPEVMCTMYNSEDRGAVVYVEAPTASYMNNYVGKNTIIGYDLYRSTKKDKKGDLIRSFTGTKVGKYMVMSDDTFVEEGKRVYYRVYAQAKNSDFKNKDGSDYMIRSESYDRTDYCVPTTISDKTVNVNVDTSATFELSFKPTETTVKEIASWQIAEKNKKGDYKDDMTVDSSYNPKSNYYNDYVKIVKAYEYNEMGLGMYAPKLKIQGKKVGTTYIKVTGVNGLTATIKVVVSDDEETPVDVNGKVIVLDPGHGGSDGGASSGGLKESSLNLKISKYTKNYLEDYGYTVYMTRSGDSYVGLEERVKMYKDKRPAAIVSQHINSSTSSSASGLECYYAIDGAGKSLASKLVEYTADETGMSSRGIQKKESNTSSGSDYYAIIRHARSYGLVGVIMENGFIQGDSKYLDSDDKLKKIAKGNAKGIRATY